MCAIFGSFNLDKFKHLHDINAYRGELSWSHCIIDPVTYKLLYLEQGYGKMTHFVDMSGYHIGHIQAPTTGSKNIHPANIENQYLWHNGILKDATVKQLQDKFNNDTVWDTNLLLASVCDGYGALSHIDGAFACVHYIRDKGIFLFRNEISPLFLDGQDMSISSTKFENSVTIQSGVVYNMVLDDNAIMSVDGSDFTTAFNPYYLGE